MDGFIKVKSELGKGSCFTAAMMVDHNPAHEAPHPPDLRAERILLVGGDAAIRHWLKRSLQAWGATCAEAETGEQAEAAWLEAEEAERPFARAVIDLPEDINPRLPAIPPERTLLLTAPELELSRQTQLLKPVTLTGLWARFAGEPLRAPEAADANAHARLPRRPLRILLAEDNEVNREVAVARLRRAGHHVSATVDGAAALELWRTKDFDAVLLDIQMPIMDGINTLPEIKKMYPEIKVIMLTMHNDHSMISKLMELGANSYLTKNSDSEIIYQAIKTVHEQEYYFNQLTNKALIDGLRTKRQAEASLPVDAKLSDKEIAILRMICEEKSTKEIADLVDLSPRTVEAIRDKLKVKTGAKSLAGLVMYAVKSGIIENRPIIN